MLGAIVGDIIGSPYEFDRGNKTKDFPLFTEESQFTDDSIMTIAIAEALMNADIKNKEDVQREVIISMQKWGKNYPDAGYGMMFSGWLDEDYPRPYNSYVNGSAMRVSPVGWISSSVEETKEIAKWTAEVSHNHPEGIKGAEATATAIMLARENATKQEIKKYIEANYNYNLSRTCDEIRPGYYHIESCQKTVPEAIIAFLEGDSFEDVIRNAVSLGGDSDTLTCIAGSIAEAYYGIPEAILLIIEQKLSPEMIEVIRLFRRRTLYANRRS